MLIFRYLLYYFAHFSDAWFWFYYSYCHYYYYSRWLIIIALLILILLFKLYYAISAIIYYWLFIIWLFRFSLALPPFCFRYFISPLFFYWLFIVHYFTPLIIMLLCHYCWLFIWLFLMLFSPISLFSSIDSILLYYWLRWYDDAEPLLFAWCLPLRYFAAPLPCFPHYYYWCHFVDCLCCAPFMLFILMIQNYSAFLMFCHFIFHDSDEPRPWHYLFDIFIAADIRTGDAIVSLAFYWYSARLIFYVDVFRCLLITHFMLFHFSFSIMIMPFDIDIDFSTPIFFRLMPITMLLFSLLICYFAIYYYFIAFDTLFAVFFHYFSWCCFFHYREVCDAIISYYFHALYYFYYCCFMFYLIILMPLFALLFTDYFLRHWWFHYYAIFDLHISIIDALFLSPLFSSVAFRFLPLFSLLILSYFSRYCRVLLRYFIIDADIFFHIIMLLLEILVRFLTDYIELQTLLWLLPCLILLRFSCLYYYYYYYLLLILPLFSLGLFIFFADILFIQLC